MFIKICKALVEKDVVVSSLKVALVVVSILNIINQGEAIFKLSFEGINWFKLVLTFMVPYMVSTYASVRVKLKSD